MVSFILTLLILVGAGFAFQKAGRAVWEGMVPFYNVFVATQVCGKPWWWAILIILPTVINFIFWALLCHAIAKKFGYGILITILLFFGIGFLYLGFAKSVTVQE